MRHKKQLNPLRWVKRGRNGSNRAIPTRAPRRAKYHTSLATLWLCQRTPANPQLAIPMPRTRLVLLELRKPESVPATMAHSTIIVNIKNGLCLLLRRPPGVLAELM
jgi:hypothetical protein